MVCAVTFTDPHRLWWLVVLPLLYWLALPPRPRQSAWTPHLAQWREAQRTLRRRPPRLSGLRFLLLAIAATAAVVAHAGPMSVAREGATRLVVVCDTSTSMAAQQANGATAFASATAALREGLASVPPHTDVTLLRCGGALHRRHGASARALHDLGGPAGALAADLAALAEAIASEPRTAVWTVTDGQGQSRLPAVGALSCVPARGPNAAVLAVRATDGWPLPGLSLAVDVVAFAEAPCTVEVTVVGAVTATPAQRVDLVAGTTATLPFALERAPLGGPLEVRVTLPGDVLPADDRWVAVLPPLPAPRIAVLADAEAGPFAHVAAQALAAEVAGTVVDATAGAAVGLLLVDGGVAAIAPGKVRALCFGSRLDPTAAIEPWLEPRIADWDRTGPLTTGLDLSDLQVQTAFPATLPPGEAFLWAADAAGGRVPLAVVCGGDETASVHFAFRLQDSNLPLLPAFPQLLRRAFVRAHGTAARLEVTSPPAAQGEQDLRAGVTAVDRPLPQFAAQPRSMAGWCLLVGLLALAVRAFVR